ncbi:MAG TPA: glycosyltransferase [Longimicrobiales bacterium]|nr:glycosyltransferase [Longimicrobiales bacterium]
MVVVQLLLNLGKGGMESMVVSLAQGLQGAGLEPVVVALDAGGEHEDSLSRSGIPYHIMGGRHFSSPAAHLKLARLLRRYGPRAVHTHHFAPLLHSLPAIELARVPRRVHTEHSSYYLPARQTYRWALRGMSRRTDAFVVVAQDMERYYAETVGISTKKLRVLPNGIDAQRFRPSADRPALRRALGLPEGLLVATAGRFFPEKDYATLLRGAALSRVPGLRVVMVGDGPLRDDLERLARELGIEDRVDFLGWRKDLPDLMPAFDLFALTSTREAFPMAILEAMASGVPVVATPVGDIPDVVEHDETGLLFPVGDADALAGCLSQVAANPGWVEAAGRRARAAVVARHSLDAMLQGYMRLYFGTNSPAQREG